MSQSGNYHSSASSKAASTITTDITNFDTWLSSADTNVQLALNTLDDVGKNPIIDPGASGDSGITFNINGVTKGSVGIDDDDSDIIKITTGANPSSGNTLMSITQDGYINMPLQPAFSAHQTLTQDNLPINNTSTLTINSEIIDQNNDYSTSAYTFTAPISGLYTFNVGTWLNDVDPASGFYLLILQTSNRSIFQGQDISIYAANADRVPFSLSVMVDMDAGDTATAKINIPNAGSSQADVQITGSSAYYTYFTGALTV